MGGNWGIVGAGLTAVGLVAACGRIGFDSQDGVDTVVVDAAASAADAATCTSWGAWGAPRRIDELASASNDGAPWVAADGLEIIFGSSRAGGAGGVDLWQATRATVAAPFGAPAPIAGLNGPSDDDNPWVTPDGLQIYYSVYDAASGAVRTATRPSRAAAFGASENLPLLDGPTFVCCLELGQDAVSGVASQASVGSNHDLVLVDRPSPGAQLRFGAPIAAASTGLFECCATLAPDGASLLYTLVGGAGNNDARLVELRRAGATFADPAAFAPTLTDADPTSQEFDAYWQADGGAVWYTRIVDGATDSDIWVVERACLAP